MCSLRAIAASGVILMACLLFAACGGGASSSVSTPPPQNPVPTVSLLAPSVIAAQAPDTTITLTGTNFLPASKVNLNGTSLATNFISSTKLTATVPSANLVRAATDQITVNNPSPGGGNSSPQTLAVTTIGSLVIIATPSNGNTGSGTWQLAIAAVDSQGNSVNGLIVALSASTGSLSQNEGETDVTGTIMASVSPPASYSGEAVIVSATAGSQTAAVNIVFVPNIFDPLAHLSRNQVRMHGDAAGTNPTSTSGQFIFGSSQSIGFTNPFLDSNPCFSNADLVSTTPRSCQPIFNSKGIVQKVLSSVDVACDAYAKYEGKIACAGSVFSAVGCVTGAGAAICAGGLKLFGPDCLKYLINLLAKKYTADPSLGVGLDLLSIGLQPPTSIGSGISDAVGLFCDDIALANAGTGSSGTQITITPSNATIVLGSSFHFASVVTPDSNVIWSVNGVEGGDSLFGTISNVGLYVAPATLPNPSQITIRATSASDQTAVATAKVTVLPNPPGTITTVAGSGVGGYSGDLGEATSAQLSTPTGIAFDGGGNMFIADFSNNVIRRVDTTTNTITTIAGIRNAGFSGDGGPGTAAELNGPTHVVFDRTVNLYITDANNERIRKVDAVTDQIVTVAGTGSASFSGDGGPAISAALNFPDGVALDSDGNLFIGDALNNRVREVTIGTGEITTVAGNGLGAYSGDGGPATNATLNFPSRPFIDTAGNLYIADFQNNRVRKVDAATGIITTIVGTGVAGYSGDGGVATNAQLNGPLSVALDTAGVLYIADVNNERIRAVNLGAKSEIVLGVTVQPGEIETVVGSGTIGYSGDGGPATSARINNPTGLIVDSARNLYFADSRNNVIRKVTGQ